MTAQTGLTASEWAAAHGMSVRQARFLMATGRVPGAVRIGSPGSPWVVLPETADPRRTGGSDGGQQDSCTERADAAHGSAPERQSYLPQLLAIVAAVQGITTRPARAVPPAAAALLLTVQRHAVDRDGACQHCRWTYPCPDYAAATEALTIMHATIVDGAA